MEAVENVENVHEKDEDYDKTNSKYFKWSEEMTSVVENNLEKMPKVILRLLKGSGVVTGRMPTSTEIYNKKAALKKQHASEKVTNTQQLREKVAKYLGEPASDVEAFVPYHSIEDEDETKEPRFVVVFATKKNIKKLKSNRVLQTDATYRLDWYGFPVFVIGKPYIACSVIVCFCNGIFVLIL